MDGTIAGEVRTALVEELEMEFDGRLAPGTAEVALSDAFDDLRQSIRSESLPQMAYTLAQHRLLRSTLTPTRGPSSSGYQASPSTSTLPSIR